MVRQVVFNVFVLLVHKMRQSAKLNNGFAPVSIYQAVFSLSLHIAIEYVKTCSLRTQAVVITSKDGTREFKQNVFDLGPL